MRDHHILNPKKKLPFNEKKSYSEWHITYEERTILQKDFKPLTALRSLCPSLHLIMAMIGSAHWHNVPPYLPLPPSLPLFLPCHNELTCFILYLTIVIFVLVTDHCSMLVVIISMALYPGGYCVGLICSLIEALPRQPSWEAISSTACQRNKRAFALSGNYRRCQVWFLIVPRHWGKPWNLDVCLVLL